MCVCWGGGGGGGDWIEGSSVCGGVERLVYYSSNPLSHVVMSIMIFSKGVFVIIVVLVEL